MGGERERERLTEIWRERERERSGDREREREIDRDLVGERERERQIRRQRERERDALVGIALTHVARSNWPTGHCRHAQRSAGIVRTFTCKCPVSSSHTYVPWHCCL